MRNGERHRRVDEHQTAALVVGKRGLDQIIARVFKGGHVKDGRRRVLRVSDGFTDAVRQGMPVVGITQSYVVNLILGVVEGVDAGFPVDLVEDGNVAGIDNERCGEIFPALEPFHLVRPKESDQTSVITCQNGSSAGNACFEVGEGVILVFVQRDGNAVFLKREFRLFCAAVIRYAVNGEIAPCEIAGDRVFVRNDTVHRNAIYGKRRVEHHDLFVSARKGGFRREQFAEVIRHFVVVDVIGRRHHRIGFPVDKDDLIPEENGKGMILNAELAVILRVLKNTEHFDRLVEFYVEIILPHRRRRYGIVVKVKIGRGVFIRDEVGDVVRRRGNEEQFGRHRATGIITNATVRCHHTQ